LASCRLLSPRDRKSLRSGVNHSGGSPGFEYGVEVLAVEHAASDESIEAFDVAVLLRTALLDERGLDILLLEPADEIGRDEFAAVV
jgi:hypothetical protein